MAIAGRNVISAFSARLSRHQARLSASWPLDCVVVLTRGQIRRSYNGARTGSLDRRQLHFLWLLGA